MMIRYFIMAESAGKPASAAMGLQFASPLVVLATEDFLLLIMPILFQDIISDFLITFIHVILDQFLGLFLRPLAGHQFLDLLCLFLRRERRLLDPDDFLTKRLLGG